MNVVNFYYNNNLKKMILKRLIMYLFFLNVQCNYKKKSLV